MNRHTPSGPLTTSRSGSFWVGVEDRVDVVDRPGHGRSPHQPDILGPMGPQMGSSRCGRSSSRRPTALGHTRPRTCTQWPGGREPGDPVYDQWLAPNGPLLASWADMHALEQARLAELLDLVGPAVLVTHSAAGPGTFLAADARPERVAADRDRDGGTAVRSAARDGARPGLGPGQRPAHLRPAAASPEDFQGGPARRLPNVSRFPIAVVTGEASMFRAFDRETVSFLERTGCDVELVRLDEHGVHGNAHGIMVERSNAEALAVLKRWVEGKPAT